MLLSARTPALHASPRLRARWSWTPASAAYSATPSSPATRLWWISAAGLLPLGGACLAGGGCPKPAHTASFLRRSAREDLRRFYRLPDEEAARLEARGGAGPATGPVVTSTQAAAEEAEESEEAEEDARVEEAPAAKRAATRGRGLRGSVSVSSSSDGVAAGVCQGGAHALSGQTRRRRGTWTAARRA